MWKMPEFWHSARAAITDFQNRDFVLCRGHLVLSGRDVEFTRETGLTPDISKWQCHTALYGEEWRLYHRVLLMSRRTTQRQESQDSEHGSSAGRAPRRLMPEDSRFHVRQRRNRDNSTRRRVANRGDTGMGQLTLVEHALCPLDSKTALQAGFVHQPEYFYCDANGRKKKASARIVCSSGLSPKDEFILWGLLALTLSQPEPTNQLIATRNFMLKQLACSGTHSNRGGRQFADFERSLERLQGVQYQSNHFYDPIRRERRKIGFGFLSYSLPADENSSRAWRIAWDSTFFEFCQAANGHLVFDLPTYRRLDCGGRRLFLLLKKIFHRRSQSLVFDVWHLGVNVLGLAPSLDLRNLKKKIERRAIALCDQDIIQIPDTLFEKHRKGEYSIRFHRGPYFEGNRPVAPQPAVQDSPLHEPLQTIGLEDATIERVIKRFPRVMVQEWADITLAAKERFGMSFFKKSPQAYFMDNIKNAAQEGRRPPDWWHQIVKEEERRQSEAACRRLGLSPEKPVDSKRQFDEYLQEDGRKTFEDVVSDLFQSFRDVGQSDRDAARNAQRHARDHLRKKFVRKQSSGEEPSS